MNPQLIAVANTIYGVQDAEECPHARIDLFDENDPGNEEPIGWHCLDCGAKVLPPTVDIKPCDEMEF